MAHPRFKVRERIQKFRKAPLAVTETFVLPMNKNPRTKQKVVVTGNEAVVRGKTGFWKVIFRKKPVS
ncbi:MAG: hypothetical protein QXO69_03705 [archaeon]